MERSLEMVVGLLGILKAGGAYVPLDPEYPDERLKFMVEDANPMVLIGRALFLDKFQQISSTLCLDNLSEKLSVFGDFPENTNLKPGTAAYLLYTSGTEGKPKAVVVEHANLVSTITALRRRFKFNQNDVMLCLASFSFDISLMEVLVPLIAGGTVRIATQDQLHSIPALVESCDGVTAIHAVPGLMREIADEIARRQSTMDWVQVRLVLTGGDIVPPNLLDQLQEIFPSAEHHVLYGPTETAIVCCAYQVPPGRKMHSYPIGRPLDNVEIRLYDSNRELVPIGIPGEVYIGGDGVSRGYWRRERLTEGKYVSIEGRRYYKSGDFAQWSGEGELFYLGRNDDQVKIRGCRVELGEVESLLGRHPEVHEAVVVVSKNKVGERKLIAYFVPREPCDRGAEQILRLKSHLSERLPNYMLPTIVQQESLPKTTNGKIDRRALSYLPIQTEEEGKNNFTLVEEILAALWADALDQEQVAMDQNFFELGGHSLSGVRLMARTQHAFGVRLSLRELFIHPTITSMARRIESLQIAGGGRSDSPFCAIPRPARIPLSLAQEGIWIHHRIEPDSSTHNIPIAVKISGPLNIDALQRSLNEVFRRHEALRTRYEESDGEPYQVVEQTQSIPLPHVELIGLAAPERESEGQRLVREFVCRPFDITRGPLLRATLIQLLEKEFTFLLVVHHLAADGWSIGILLKEVCSLYEAYALGSPYPLRSLPVQYADYSIWQRLQLTEPAMQDQIEYSKEMLGTGMTTFPTNRVKVQESESLCSEVTHVLSKELAEQLKALNRQEGVTLFLTMLAAFKVLLFRYTGSQRIIVGTPMAGRNRVEIQDLIGQFVNIVPIRTDLKEVSTFREFLQRVRMASLQAYAHQEIPIDYVVDEVTRHRKNSHRHAVPIVFSFDPSPSTAIGDLVGLKMERLPIEALGRMYDKGRDPLFDISLAVAGAGHCLLTTLVYRTALFSSTAAIKMMERFERLLWQVASDPAQRLEDLLILTDEEIQVCQPINPPRIQLSRQELESLILELELS